jgi:transcriptional regulator with XRE-family HTH domain
VEKVDLLSRNEQIVELRRTGWSQARLCERFGISQSTVSQILSRAGLPRAYVSERRRSA